MANFKNLPSAIYLHIYEFLEVNKMIFKQKKKFINNKKSNDLDIWIKFYASVMDNIENYYSHFKFTYIKNYQGIDNGYKVKKKGIEIFPTLWKDFVDRYEKEHDDFYADSGYEPRKCKFYIV